MTIAGAMVVILEKRYDNILYDGVLKMDIHCVNAAAEKPTKNIDDDSNNHNIF